MLLNKVNYFQYVILGIDEAGRGSVVGPLVISGFLISENSVDKLKAIGVKDSKLVAYDDRATMKQELKKIAVATKTIVIEPNEIDLKLKTMSLNDLETIKMAEIINSFPEATKVIIDCPDANPLKFKGFIYRYINNKELINNLIAEHKADLNYPVVSAASIFAKVNRDTEIERIKSEININIGSGYPSDPLTKKFLDEYWNIHTNIMRQSWQTWKDVKAKKMQKNLFDF